MASGRRAHATEERRRRTEAVPEGAPAAEIPARAHGARRVGGANRQQHEWPEPVPGRGELAEGRAGGYPRGIARHPRREGPHRQGREPGVRRGDWNAFGGTSLPARAERLRAYAPKGG